MDDPLGVEDGVLAPRVLLAVRDMLGDSDMVAICVIVRVSDEVVEELGDELPLPVDT